MHKAAFTPESAAMLLIDHQLGTMGWTHSHDINLVKANALKLARIAKALEMPVVLTASMEDQVQGPLMPELAEILPEAFARRVKRPGIVNAMHHEGFNKAVKSTGRKKMFVAGITTEICVVFPVLQMLDEGYEVQVSADASASWSKYGDELALRRMEKAGAIITTVDQIISELAIDWTSPNGNKLQGIANGPMAVSGTDVAHFVSGRIHSLYVFLVPLPLKPPTHERKNPCQRLPRSASTRCFARRTASSC